jgi:rhodanese-related sulfurtransferase
VLTGDTLFVGDVGRPDLLASKGMTSEELAAMLYDSLHGKLVTLPESTRVYPAHGAGSACGKSLSLDTWSTIGDQKRSNYALAPMSKAAFVAAVTEGQTAPPAYFSFDASRNREAREILDEAEPVPALSLDEVLRHQRQGAVVLDTRDPADFALGHLGGSVNVGLGGRYAELVGGIVQPGAPIVLVADPDLEVEARNRLARIGFDTVIGYLPDALTVLHDNPDEAVRSHRVDVAELESLRSHGELQLIDVRQPGELGTGTIDGARNIPLTMLNKELASLDASKRTIVFCAGGYRSSIAASKMAAAGFTDVADLLGGYSAWAAAHGTSR